MTNIRWIIRRDMPEVRVIEKASFEFPWSRDDFILALRQRNCVGMVAETDAIVGYMLYELHKEQLNIINFAVSPSFKRQGIGREMIEKLKSKLHEKRKSSLCVGIRETNFEAQQFFRASGFQVTNTLKNYYEDTTEDTYLMKFSIRVNLAVLLTNRFSKKTKQ